MELVERGEESMSEHYRCDGVAGCQEPITHLDNKGYIYCTKHGIERRDVRPCRKLRPHELKKLARGEQIEKY